MPEFLTSDIKREFIFSAQSTQILGTPQLMGQCNHGKAEEFPHPLRDASAYSF